jgi:hypothetical protein
MPTTPPPNPNAPPPRPESIPPLNPETEYAKCFAIAAEGRPWINLNAPPGQKRVDLQRLRCVLLTETRLDIGKRVLELDNYFDCRDERAPNRTEIINAAIASYGSGVNAGFLDEILAELDEVEETGGSHNLGPVKNLIGLIRGGWPRDPSARQGLEAVTQLSASLVGAVADIIGKAVPGASKYTGDAVTLLKLLLDMLFFIGDYVSEVEAIQKELGVRILSYSDITSPTNPYGIGRVQTIRGAYAATYGGVVPSMTTVRSWCRTGKALGTPYLAPDGTNGRWQAAYQEWTVRNAVAAEILPQAVQYFGGDFKRFVAANTVYSAIYGAYAESDAEEILTEIAKAAVDPASDSERLLVATEAINFCGAPANEWQSADTLSVPDPYSIGACPSTYIIPFWEDTTGPNWNWQPRVYSDGGIRRAIERKRAILPALNMAGYYWQYLRTIGGKQYPTIESGTKGLLARDMLFVMGIWNTIVNRAFPYYGKTKRARKKREMVEGLISLLAPAGTPSATNKPWEFYSASSPRQFVQATWALAVRIVVTGSPNPTPKPEKTDAAYASVKARCPDNTSACLPCDTIKNRRPIGAKVIDIPLVVEWTAPAFVTLGTTVTPFMSPEYAAWRKNLRDNGYPDYYIDCVARDVTFVQKGAAKVISNLTLSGAQGLRAPAVALLTGSNQLGATLKRFDPPGLSQQDAAALAQVMRKPEDDTALALKVGAGLLIAALVIRGVRSGA